MILVIAEQRDGKLNRATWETIAAAQQLAGRRSRSRSPCSAPRRGGVAPGAGAGRRRARCSSCEHAALEPYTPDALRAGAAARRSSRRRRTYVLLPHTYQTRDFAPMLAARLDRALVTDVTGINGHGAGRRVRAADVPGQARRRRACRKGRRRTW